MRRAPCGPILFDSVGFEVIVGTTGDAPNQSRVTLRCRTGSYTKGVGGSLFLTKAQAIAARDALIQMYPIPDESYWTVPYTDAAPETDEMVVVVRAPDRKSAIERARAYIQTTFYKPEFVKIHPRETRRISLADVFDIDAQMVPEA